MPINASGKKHYSFQEVVRTYKKEKLDEEIRGMWSVIVLYRWISLIITPWFLNASVSATTITLFSLILTLCIPLTLLFDVTSGYIYLSILGIIINILDCVDGDIARTANGITKPGHYLDFIVDVIYRITVYVTLGLIVHNNISLFNINIMQPLLLASLAALMVISARMSRIYVENKFAIQAFPGQDFFGSGKKINNIIEKIFSFVSGLDYFLPIFILIAGIFNKIHWIIVWIFFYSALDFLYTQFSILRQLK